MPIETVADRRALLVDDGDVGVLARTATNVAGPDGETVMLAERPVTGLFDRAYIETLNQSGFRPVFCLLDEDAVHLVPEHRLMLAGRVYDIRSIEPDGEGFTQLSLHLVGPYVVSRTWGYGQRYGARRYGGRGARFDAANPPLAYPFTVAGVLETTGGATRL